MKAEAACRVINRDGRAPFVIVCDHASNLVPAELNALGLPASELERHIAYDIGAAAIADILARSFDATAVFSAVSRLVIDCNRFLTDPSSIPVRSDETDIPGNAGLSAKERESRAARYFQPYQSEIESIVDMRMSAGTVPALLSVHSMTDRMRGVTRPWEIALSWWQDERMSGPMLALLKSRAGITVGDNEPYALDPREDYTTTVHALGRGLPHMQVEFRQDLVANAEGQRHWAGVFGECLEKVTADQSIFRVITSPLRRGEGGAYAKGVGG